MAYTADKPIPPRAVVLLETAEKLFAEKGLQGVSIREINRAAGNRNHTALQYHFGSLENLVQAILDYRVLPLDAARREYLQNQAPQEKQVAEPQEQIRFLLEAMVVPFARQLLEPAGSGYYISLMAQIFSGSGGVEIFLANSNRVAALLDIHQRIEQLLSDIPKNLLMERMQIVGITIVQTVARWEREQREGQRKFSEQTLEPLMQDLVDFMAVGLQVPVSNFNEQ